MNATGPASVLPSDWHGVGLSINTENCSYSTFKHIVSPARTPFYPSFPGKLLVTQNSGQKPPLLRNFAPPLIGIRCPLAQ